MVPRKKINLQAVRACLDTICTKCGQRIKPDKIIRVDFERQRCPSCGEVFDVAKSKMDRAATEEPRKHGEETS